MKKNAPIKYKQGMFIISESLLICIQIYRLTEELYNSSKVSSLHFIKNKI